MNNDEFDNYLTLVTRLLRLNRSQSDSIGYELRDHLESRIAEQVEDGVDPAVAKRRALEEFGDAASFAQQFKTVLQSYRRRWMMRFTTFAIAGSFLVVLLAFSLWPEGARFGTPGSSLAQESSESTQGRSQDTEQSVTTGLNEKGNKVLEEEATFDFDSTTFDMVMDYLRDKYQINVLLAQSARDDLLTEDEPITFRINKVRLKKALDLMLREKNATYRMEDGVLIFISLDVASDPENFERRIIDARSLLKKIRTAENTRLNAANSRSNVNIYLGSYQTGRGASGFGGSGGGGGLFQLQDALGGFSNAPTQAAPTQTQSAEANLKQFASEIQAADGTEKPILFQGPISVFQSSPPSPETMLEEVVKSTVDPDGWENSNGDGSMEILGGLIILHNSRSVNDKVQDLVKDLEHRMAN